MTAQIIQWDIARRHGCRVTEQNRDAINRVMRRKFMLSELDAAIEGVQIPDYSVDRSYPVPSGCFSENYISNNLIRFFAKNNINIKDVAEGLGKLP